MSKLDRILVIDALTSLIPDEKLADAFRLTALKATRPPFILTLATIAHFNEEFKYLLFRDMMPKLCRLCRSRAGNHLFNCWR